MFDINTLCQQRGWTRAHLILKLRHAASARGKQQLPPDESLRRMIREWARGTRQISDFYLELFAEAFGLPVPVHPSPPAGGAPEAALDDQLEELANRLTRAAVVDLELVTLFETQTQSLRTLDRRLGAPQVLVQTEAHLSQMRELLTHSFPGAARTPLAAAVAEAASLAGWQALDLGDPAKAWQHYEAAKAAARECDSPGLLAHATAEQAYALLDIDRPEQALALAEHARDEAGLAVPVLLRSWLCAATAEMHAACGHGLEAQRLLDDADRSLPVDCDDPALPFLFLNRVHLARWRGSCLARLGASEAIDDLNRALVGLDPTFARAEAGHRCELAMAYSAQGLHEEARREAQRASDLAKKTASVRQRRRINRLLSSGEPGRSGR